MAASPKLQRDGESATPMLEPRRALWRRNGKRATLSNDRFGVVRLLSHDIKRYTRQGYLGSGLKLCYRTLHGFSSTSLFVRLE